ncbi:hypothetical protein GON01_02515 [Sphingomonas sp. MAH-20]|uniref:Uncharacterized protein n=1 Tax=Sphingomonas horti TaxID=2682842 RepID=A0A6I4IXG1_9SPHN|nr:MULTISPECIES: hypothetical protein [Sphingomonas]MBA2920562.1 hypothetical protein [Sphingomonas sp. CGMCC 1.13658]MVO76814.1 hypothetical protein [Sphingomonas horti]
MSEDLKTKITSWLANEGYPLEYFTAATFRDAGLSVYQGLHVRADMNSKPREMDVVAQATFRDDHRWIRLETVVECKWSADKPLIAFTSPQARMQTSACIAQTISSEVWDALLWLLRGSPLLHGLALFRTPENPAFGGRQAFGNQDRFYGALASVTAACSAVVRRTDRMNGTRGFVPEYGIATFPVIVVDAPLFEASYDDDNAEVSVKEVQSTRCHWRGSADWPLVTTIDVVTRDALSDFAYERSADFQKLGMIALEQLDLLLKAYAKKDKDIIFGQRGVSGRSAAPRLLQQLFRLSRSEETEPVSPLEGMTPEQSDDRF